MTIRSEMTTCSEKGEMWPRTDLLDLLGIRHPILQAPMSTYDGPQLVATVSNAGALGSLGCCALPTQTARDHIQDIRRRIRNRESEPDIHNGGEFLIIHSSKRTSWHFVF